MTLFDSFTSVLLIGLSACSADISTFSGRILPSCELPIQRITYWDGAASEVSASCIIAGPKRILTARHNLPAIYYATAPQTDGQKNGGTYPTFPIRVGGQVAQGSVLDFGRGETIADDWVAIFIHSNNLEADDRMVGTPMIDNPVVGESVLIIGYPNSAGGELVGLAARVERVSRSESNNRSDLNGSFEVRLIDTGDQDFDVREEKLHGLSGGAIVRM